MGDNLRTQLHFLNASDSNSILFDTVTFKNLNFSDKFEDTDIKYTFLNLEKTENVFLKNITFENCSFENQFPLYFENINAQIHGLYLKNIYFFSLLEHASLIFARNSDILIIGIEFTNDSILKISRLITFESQTFANNFKLENLLMKNVFYGNNSGLSIFFVRQANSTNIMNIRFQNIIALGIILFKFENCKFLTIQKAIFHSISLSKIIQSINADFLFISSSFFSSITSSNSLLNLITSFSFLSNSSFEKCISISSSLLMVSSPSTHFLDISFLNNLVIHEQEPIIQGGCLYYNLGSGGIKIKNSIYFKNAVISSFSSGSPCLYADSEDDELHIQNSFFLENWSSNNDICVSHHGEKIEITNSTFKFNENANMDEGSNGALSLASAIMILNNVTLNGNKAAYGSAILIQNSFSKAFTYGYFQNIKVSNNTALYGQILFYSNLGLFNFTFLNSHFINNLCLFKGGVVLTWYAVYGNVISFTSCHFIENSAYFSGGVFYLANLGNHMILTNCFFLQNMVLKDGGGGVVCMYGDPNTILMTKNSYFLNNSSPSKGGVFLITTGTVLEEESQFINNTAHEGGSFAINFFSMLEMRNSLIKKSIASSSAGLIKMMGQSDVKIINVEIRENYAPRGGVFVTGGLTVLRIEGSLFEMNYAINGTLMYSTNAAFVINFLRSLISKNGGNRNLFELNSCSLYFEEVRFDGNRMNIFNAGLSSLILMFVFVQDNACEKGQIGCILNIASKSEIFIDKSIFYDIKSAEFYGNIYLSNSIINITKSYFEKLAITLEGSLIYGDSSTIFLNDSFIYNFESIAIKLTSCQLYLFFTKIEQKINKNNKKFEGSIVCIRCLHILMFHSTIINTINYLDKIAALAIIRNTIYETYKYEILNSNFTNNTGKFGGAIYIENSNITIENSIFNGNAGQSGGSIFLSCDDTLICDWNITSNVFINNKANVSGGAIKWKSQSPLRNTLNVFKNNTALFGEEISSQPIKIAILKPEDFSQFNQYKSGDVTKPFQFQIIDYYKQIVQSTNGFGLISLKTDRINEINSLIGSLAIEIIENKLTFDALTLVASPNSVAALILTTSLIQTFYKNLLDTGHGAEEMFTERENNSTKQYEFVIQVFLRSCQIGEIFLKDKNICQRCSAGQFSLSTDDSACFECLSHAVCHGGADISLNPGYWRQSNSSKKIYECIIDGACLGGSKFEDSCLSGYSGPLCDVCVSNGSIQYYKYGGSKCDSCNDLNPLGFIFFAFFYLFLIVYVGFTIKKNIDSSEKTKLDYEIPVYLKIGMDYIQVLSIIPLLNITWPSSFSNMINTSGSAGNLNSILFPFECILFQLSSVTNIFYLKIYLGSIFAWFNFAFSIIIWILFLKLKKKTINSFRKEIVITIMVVGFTLQPSIVNMYFTALNCIEINGELYVKKQLSLQCWEGDHLNIFLTFILPSLLLWSIILPIICWVYVKQNIYSPNYQVRASLSFIMKGVRKDFYYWEFVMMAKRYLLSIISVFMISDMIVAVCSILLVLFFFSMIHYKLRPYNMAVFNHILDISCFSSYFIYMICLYYVIEKSGNSRFICLIFIMILIFGFFLRISQYLLLAYKEKIKGMVSRLNRNKTRMASKKENIIESEIHQAIENSISKEMVKKQKRKNAQSLATKIIQVKMVDVEGQN